MASDALTYNRTKSHFALWRTVIISCLLGWTSYSANGAESPNPPAVRQKVEKADDLPRHTYAVAKLPSILLLDDAGMATLAHAIGQDIEADAKAYDIQDRTTLQDIARSRLALAMLDKDYAGTLRLVAELRTLEDKPALKLASGITAEAWAKAHLASSSSTDFAQAYQAALVAAAQALPFKSVQTYLVEQKGGFEIRSPTLLVGVVKEQIDPAAASTGTISATAARTLLNFHNQIVNFLPYKAEIVSALAAVISPHEKKVPDLWTVRMVDLGPQDKAQLVRIGIWDSGVDISQFPQQRFTDENGKPGFAYTLETYPSTDYLYPLGDNAARADELTDRIKGFSDVQAGVDSPEATALKKYMSGLKPEQVKPTLEGLNQTVDYIHGTHVAGIAVAGNPYARLVIGRLTFDYHMIPALPNVEWAKRNAAMYHTAAAYFEAHHVRAVNMSWGVTVKDFEDALEANGAGGNAEERKKLARQLYDIDAGGLKAALAEAHHVLFVAAAGNSNDNAKFDEIAPSSFQLPNLITVGAVNQAGEETSFSSFGPMVNVSANGYEVVSTIPGGRRIGLSGTSMAAPEVTNLAGKLFALDPALTPEEARALIVNGCDQNGRVNLVSEVKSIALLKAKMGGK